MRTRRRLAMARVNARMPTAALRMLPDFVIIGAQRCGTSSLYKNLGHHPDLVSSLRKEVEYFSVRYQMGERWYRSHFPLRARRLGHGGLRTFEATPDYLFDHRAPPRAAELIPGARLIALLRNPTERAFSHYQHNLRLGHEPLGFDEALEREDARVEGEVDRMLQDPHYPALRLRRYGYVRRGFYAEQLVRWLACFPVHQLLVIRSEDLFADPAKTLGEILSFLELRQWRSPEFRNYSYAAPGRRPSSELPSSLRDRLTAIFAPHNQRLEDLLGRDFAWEAPGPAKPA
jgi:hypothetical protein